MIIILDSGVLGILATPLQNTDDTEEREIEECNEWLYTFLAKGVYIVTSEISDYEVRREFIRIKSQGLELLESLKKPIDFLPLTTEVMKKAAQFWAYARQNHIPTTDNKNIDADMIISAHWNILSQQYPGRGVFIATTNVKHLKIFAQDQAQEWRNLRNL